MFWVKSGSVTLKVDMYILHVEEGECAFIGANQIFSLSTASSFNILMVRFTDTFYCRHELDMRFLDSCIFFDNSQEPLKYKLHHLVKLILKQYYDSLNYICTQSFDELMCHFAHNTIERLLLFSQKELMSSAYSPIAVYKPHIDTAYQFRQLVKDNCRDNKLVAFYADKLNISIKRLTEICRNSYGQSPKKIISEQVALEAKRLLRHSTLNIKEIAFELRFQEPSNFIRFFVNSTGMTPKEFRDKN